MYNVSPGGADSNTKVDSSQRVIRLSGNSTPGGQSVTSNGAGRSPAEVILCCCLGTFVTGVGHFGNSRKTVTWPPENRGSVAFSFILKPWFSVLKP